MKPNFTRRLFFVTLPTLLSVLALGSYSGVYAQSCPAVATTSITADPDTYFPGTASAASGTSSVTIGASTYGTTPIAIGDVVLIIQMQGSQINAVNSASYGSNTGTGNGYTTTNLSAGYMEFATAASAVTTAGGALTLKNPLTNSYVSSAYGTYGQYTFQVIRVPLYYNLQLNASFGAPAWNGATGGVIVLDATNQINLNSQVVSVTDSGFRGGGGRSLGGGSGTATDYITLSTNNANGSKGEGISGTPRFVLNEGNLLDNTVEGYPSGSYARGAPGNAGGGGTDYIPSHNADNAGGGGGGNGGLGGQGGEGWSASGYSGGFPGAIFAQASPSRMIMGGGGGSGDTNNGTGTPAGGIASSGVAGGGIVIMITQTFTGTGTINANGGIPNNTTVNDGSGGGGAGGTVLLYGTSGFSGITVNAAGGNGANNLGASATPAGAHGPGGGGGGGIIYSAGTLAATNVTGGIAGTTAYGTESFLATNGNAGTVNQGITTTQLPVGATTCMTLPVTFLSISAAYNAGTINVNWTVTNEINVQDYKVERSLDGINFDSIGVVARQNAYYTGINEYSYPDIYKGNVATLYYRVVEEDEKGGKLSVSNIVAVAINDNKSLPMVVAPNPVKNSATISFTSESNQPITARMIAMNGAVVWQKQFPAGLGRRLLSMDDTENVATGIYIFQCTDGEHMEQTKLMVAH